MAWLSGWDQRVKLTTDSGDITSALSNFPILLYISASSGRNNDDISFVFDELQSDANRKKIAVTQSDGTTECKVEIEKWDDANEKAWLWVKAPSIASGSDTDFYLYYDIDHADNDTNVGDKQSAPAEAVWDSNFKLVQHMDEDPSGSSPQMKDSTSNDEDGTSGGSMTSGDQVAAKVNGGLEFDGNNDWMNFGNLLDFSATPFTIEIWFKPITIDTSDERTFISKWHASSGSREFRFEITKPDKKITLSTQDGTEYFDMFGTTVLQTGVWYHAVVTINWAGNDAYLYVNGIVEDDETNSWTSGMNYSTNPVVLACRKIGVDQWFNGVIDEVRISNVARNSAWIKASYETQRDHLLAWGSEESGVTHYTITADGGSFVETGQAVNVLKGFLIGIATAAFILTGTAVGLNYGYKVSAGAGSYVESGQTVNLLKGFEIDIAAGSYAETGQAANLEYDRIFSVDAGSYIETGQAVSLEKGFALGLASGTYAETGQAVALLKGYGLDIGVGSFLETGQIVGLLRAGKIVIGVGTFSLIGQDVDLSKAVLISEAGSYILTGQDVTLTKGAVGYSLVCDAGAFSITGQAVALLKGYGLDIGIGSFIETGQTVSLLRDAKLDIGTGSYSEVGQSLSLLKGFRVAIGSGSYAETGTVVDLLKGYLIAIVAGNYTETGQVVGLLKDSKIAIGEGNFVETGQVVSLLRDTKLDIGAGSYILTGQIVELFKGRTITALAGTFTETGQAVSLLRTGKVVIGSGTFDWIGFAVTLTKSEVEQYILNAFAGSFTLVGQTVELIWPYWLKKDKPSTDFQKEDKPSTSFQKKDKPSTDWEKVDKPATSYQKKDKPSTDWGKR